MDWYKPRREGDDEAEDGAYDDEDEEDDEYDDDEGVYVPDNSYQSIYIYILYI